jgi:hypothetical protein
MAVRDLYHGSGGARMRPNLRRFTLIEEEKGGYSKKYRVRAGAKEGFEFIERHGRRWSYTVNFRKFAAEI